MIWAIGVGILLAGLCFFAERGKRVAGRESIELLPRSTFLPCDASLIDVGQKVWRFALMDGFYTDEAGSGTRSFAWTKRDASLVLMLGRGEARTLTVVARAFPENLRVRAFLNGAELGARSVPRNWSSLIWELPADRVRAGPNRLELRSSTQAFSRPGRRKLALAIDRVEVQPSSCLPGEAAPIRLASSRPVELVPGSLLISPSMVPPSPRLEIEAEAAPGSVVEVYSYDPQRQTRLERITVDGSGRLTEEILLGECCQPDAGLLLLARGPGVVRLTSLEVAGDDRPLAWRLAYGMITKQALLFGVITLVLLGLAYGRLRVPFPGAAPWLDAVLVALLALLLRLAFLQLYPTPSLDPDSSEYLMRARRLIAGASFWQETSWHAWQTWIRAPGFFLFLATVLGSLEGELVTVVKLHAVLSALAAGTTYLIAFPLFGRGAALAAGLLFACHVESMVRVTRIMPEELYMVLLLSALAAVAWLSTRPSWKVAAVAGVLFGLAVLVRSGPLYYVPLAAITLLAIHGLRVGRRLAIILVACMTAVILPWCVRNSMIYGTLMGVDDMVIVNLLQVAPDDRFVWASDLDLSDPEQYERYYYRLKRANADRQLTRQGRTVVAATLETMIRNPRRTASRLAENLSVYASIFADDFVPYALTETRKHRIVVLTDLMNIQYLLLVALGTAGFVISVRDRRGWPIALWFLFHLVVVNLFFHAQFRFRFTTLPVLMVFSGLVLARVLGRIRDARVGAAAEKQRRPPTPVGMGDSRVF